MRSWPSPTNREQGDHRVNLAIEGMTCNCAGQVDSALSAVPGVTLARVNLAAERAEVVSDAALAVDKLVAAVEATGYHAHLMPRPRSKTPAGRPMAPRRVVDAGHGGARHPSGLADAGGAIRGRFDAAAGVPGGVGGDCSTDRRRALLPRRLARRAGGQREYGCWSVWAPARPFY